MAKKVKVLLVEDDKNLGIILNEYLQAKGFISDLAVNGEEGSTLFYQNSYDICILDVMMPKKDGFTLAKEIRQSDDKIPILFLTAKSLKEDTLQGFKIGADDYITKPFNMEELVMRINAVLRRVKGDGSEKKSKNGKIVFGKFTFRPAEQSLEFEGIKEKLTTKESKLLHLFLKKRNHVLDKKTALQVAWEDDSYFNSRSMDVYINKLRKKLKNDPSVEIITIHREGYRLNY